MLRFPAWRFSGSGAAVAFSSMMGHDSIHWRKQCSLGFILTNCPLSEDSYLNFIGFSLYQAFSDVH